MAQKRVIKVIWWVISIMVIISMFAWTFAPGL